MTCALAVTENGATLLAADSAGSSIEHNEIHTFENAKVFLAGPYGIGFTTSYRLGQILRFETEFPAPPTGDLERFMATSFIAAVRRGLEVGGLSRELNEHGSILVAVHGQLFCIGSEFQVMAMSTPYAAVGSGRHPAYGALYAMEGCGKTLREKAEIALRASQTFTPGVREPFTFVEVPT